MSNPKVLCLGEILFDLIADEVGKPIEQVTGWTAYPGGAPANVATALAKLGTAAGFIGCIGSDDPGDELVQLLQTVGVDDSGIQRHPTAPTRQVYVTRSEAGDREFAGFGDRPTTEFADTHLQAEALPVSLFEAADFLVLGTLELAYPDSRAAIERALELAEEYSLKIVLDINWRRMFWPNLNEAQPLIRKLVERVDFLKLSEEEADWLFHTTAPQAISYQINDLEGVLVTAGSKGCAYYLSENIGRSSAFSVVVEDTTGAGDAFLAGFLHQLCQRGIQGLSQPGIAREIVAYANAVGSLTTTRPGAIAAQPTAAEVDAFLYMQSPNKF